MDENDETPGDLGGGSARPLAHRRIEERAVRERWPMSHSVRVKVLRRLCKVLDEDADHSPLPPPGYREVIAASRALLGADRLNLEQEKLDFLRRAAESAGIGEVHERMREYLDPDDPLAHDRPGGPGPGPGVVPEPVQPA